MSGQIIEAGTEDILHRPLQSEADSALFREPVAAEAPVEESVGHEIEQVRVHLIPALRSKPVRGGTPLVRVRSS